ncbi:MAG: NAD(P)H-dependent oxidoreductase subunit E [Rhodocyclaceae bacterium]|nr:NAD(P)H-dependent oxidoreductase subunit E [Rhodocyclaceae bacterium]MBX3667018.1 NAD(P)H-dependent oxidoreductase subunit E [Rhodocyclaceae bacterium]
MSSATLESILDRHARQGVRLMQILRETQEALGWLPPEALGEIARATGLTRAAVESTANFYSFFHTRPLGHYRVLWSDNITDRMLGNQALMQALCKALWLQPGRVSEDGLVSVDTTSCTGMCDQGPAVLVNYRTVTNMNLDRVQAMAALIRARVPVAEWPEEWFQIADNIRRAGLLLDCPLAPGAALAAGLARGGAGLLDEIRTAGLRGRGGAGFSTAQKWQSCRDARSPAADGARYVVCNADEGEPGTFKDRVLLTRCPDLVFEGMTLAGLAVGARRGFLYLRGEYRYLLDALEAVLARRRAAGLLGASIAGSNFAFDIEIHLGAGAYVCGEESALIESLEGKPGKPRIRPPFPVTSGYLNCPTTVNNVETLASACLIAAHGGAWFARSGTKVSTGSKILSVSGDCAHPGIYEYPFGVSVQQVLEDCGAQRTLAVQVSGPSGVLLAPDEFERRIAFEDVPSAGAFMVFDETRDMFEVARNFAHFFAHESCGFCTPCRVGTAINARFMDKIAAGHGSRDDLEQIFRMHRLMQATSHCGLGQTAANPIFDTLRKFRPSYDRRIESLHFEPAFDLDAALSRARRMTGRDDPAAHLTNEHQP